GGVKQDVQTVRGDILTARLLPDGTLAGQFVALGVLPVAVHSEGAVAYDGELYVAGGATVCNPSFGGQPSGQVGDVQVVGLHADGSLATPMADLGPAFGDAGYRNKLAAYDGNLYWVGGRVGLNGTGSNAAGIWQGAIAGPGQLALWSYVPYTG